MTAAAGVFDEKPSIRKGRHKPKKSSATELFGEKVDLSQNTTNIEPPTPEFMMLAREIREMKEVIRQMSAALAQHIRHEFVNAHPRSGDLRTTLRYLGFSEKDIDKLVAELVAELHPPATDVAPEAVV